MKHDSQKRVGGNHPGNRAPNSNSGMPKKKAGFTDGSNHSVRKCQANKPQG